MVIFSIRDGSVSRLLNPLLLLLPFDVWFAESIELPFRAAIIKLVNRQKVDSLRRAMGDNYLFQQNTSTSPAMTTTTSIEIGVAALPFRFIIIVCGQFVECGNQNWTFSINHPTLWSNDRPQSSNIQMKILIY